MTTLVERDENSIPDNLPSFLKHSDLDTPTPTWSQFIDGSGGGPDRANEYIVGGEHTWISWSGPVRRSVALLTDKIGHEGWLDAIESIDGWPWDGGFYFRPRDSCLAEALSSTSGYIDGSIRRGLFAHLSTWGHRGWVQSWMENDSATGLHVGTFKSGIFEVHLDAFNALFINGAPRADVIRLPLLGSYNNRLYWLHRKWEQSEHGVLVRTSANFYHLMRESVPLSF